MSDIPTFKNPCALCMKKFKCNPKRCKPRQDYHRHLRNVRRKEMKEWQRC